MTRKVHLIDSYNMKILKEYSSAEVALRATAQNTSDSVLLGVEGTERAYLLNEFRKQFSNK